MQLKQDIQYEHWYSDSDEPEETDYPVIPTHSHLTLAWVEGGILGGTLWIYILVLIIRGVLRVTALRSASGTLIFLPFGQLPVGYTVFSFRER